MSGLIYKGNAVTGLGEFMPSLIIEKVYVNDASLDLHLAVYWPQEPTLLSLGSLTGLHFYALLAFDQNNTEKVINREISIFSQFVGEEASSPTYFEVGPGGSALGYAPNYITNYIDLSANVFIVASVQVPEIIYDADENMLYKTTFEINLPWEDTYLPSVGLPAAFTDFETFFEDKLSANKSMTLFCFPTIYDVTDDINWDSVRMDLTSPNNVVRILSDGTEKTMGYNYSFPPEATPLIERGIGDITYESIFVDGQVDTEPKVAYIDEEGVYFDEVPLVALNAEYYKPDSITHAEIIDKFNIILSSFDPDPETEIELSGVVDSISYALSVYGKDADILHKLDSIRKAFPERGSATKTGRLFDQFSSAIAGTNRQIKSNDILHKVLYRSPKVIDNRTVPAANITTATSPTVSDSDGYDPEVIYKDALISREVYYIPTVAGTSTDKDGEYTEWETTSDDPALALNWGYFFCDFEKVLHRDTDLAQLLDIKKVDKLFGHQLMNSAVKLTGYPGYLARLEAEVSTYVEFDFSYVAAGLSGTSADWIATTWPDPNGTQEWTDTGTIWPNQWARPIATATPGVDGEATGHSYIALRAIDLASSQGLYSDALGHDYRLMCFEFEDYYTAQINIPGEGGAAYKVIAPSGTAYETTITFRDCSLQILDGLKEKLRLALAEYATYESVASEHCNYNDMGSYFNSFFVNAMNAEYGDNPEESPWFVLASLYYLYSDLLDSTSDKSLEEIGALAAQQVTKISPNSGNLEDIANFKTAVDALYTQLMGINYDGYDEDRFLNRYIRIFDGLLLEYNQIFDLSDVPLYIGDDVAGEAAEVVEEEEPGELKWAKIGSTWEDTAWYVDDASMNIDEGDMPPNWGTPFSGTWAEASWQTSDPVETLDAFWNTNRGTLAQGSGVWGVTESEVIGNWTRVYFMDERGGNDTLVYIFAEITNATFDFGTVGSPFDYKGKMKMTLYECQEGGVPSNKCSQRPGTSTGAADRQYQEYGVDY